MNERAGGGPGLQAAKCECCNVVNVSAIQHRASAIIIESDGIIFSFFFCESRIEPIITALMCYER